MEYEAITKDHYKLMALRQIPGTTSSREMKYRRSVEIDFEKQCPILSQMLRCAKVLANIYLRKTIKVDMKYKFSGLNFLRNRMFPMEQYIHLDFEDPRRGTL